MGKKAKMIKKLTKGNKVLLAALTGAAAGIALAGILGSEKAKELLSSVEGNIADFGNRLANGTHREPSKVSR